MATNNANDNPDKRPDDRTGHPSVKTITVKNQSNRTVEIEINSEACIVFAPHETKQVDEALKHVMLTPLFIQGAK